MTKEEFIEINSLEDGTVILEDWDTFKGGIVGVSEDRCHIIYSYDALVKSLSESYKKDEPDLTEEELNTMAIDWIEYNTIRSIPYMPKGYEPIIMIEVEV